jgi:hypothetical protein
VISSGHLKVSNKIQGGVRALTVWTPSPRCGVFLFA